MKAALEKIDSPAAPDMPAGQLPDVIGLDAETIEFLGRASGGELGSMLRTELRWYRWRRMTNIAAKAAARLQKLGRQPGPADLKVLIPALEAGSLEDDEEMADRWAALLANAADPQGSGVEPGFPDVLRQLSSSDARLLEHIVSRVDVPRGLRMYASFDRATLKLTGPIKDSEEFMVSLDNLQRLRLLVAEPIAKEKRAGRPPNVTVDQSRMRLTAYGAKFALAVRRNEQSGDGDAPDSGEAPEAGAAS